jgi:hypothetical protein
VTAQYPPHPAGTCPVSIQISQITGAMNQGATMPRARESITRLLGGPDRAISAMTPLPQSQRAIVDTRGQAVIR